MSYIIIGILIFTAITHLIKIVFLLRKNNLGTSYFFKPPTKFQLALYYILTITVCIWAIGWKLGIDFLSK